MKISFIIEPHLSINFKKCMQSFIFQKLLLMCFKIILLTSLAEEAAFVLNLM